MVIAMWKTYRLLAIEYTVFERSADLMIITWLLGCDLLIYKEINNIIQILQCSVFSLVFEYIFEYIQQVHTTRLNPYNRCEQYCIMNIFAYLVFSVQLLVHYVCENLQSKLFSPNKYNFGRNMTRKSVSHYSTAYKLKTRNFEFFYCVEVQEYP